MKKINTILIIVVLALTFLTILTKIDEGIVEILKNLSIILTITIPYIIEKTFKTNIDEGLKTLWIIFIIMAQFLGISCYLYDNYVGYDKIVHTISGIVSGYIALLLLGKQKFKSSNILFIMAFSALCALSWEIFEFFGNLLVGGDAQKVMETGVNDTMLDMIVALIGSLFVCLLYILKNKKTA